MQDVDRHRIIVGLVGEATEEDLRLLREWRDSDPENEAEYQRVAEFWQASGRLHASEQADLGRDFLESVAEIAVRQRKGDDSLPGVSSSVGLRNRARWAWAGWFVAASLVAAIALPSVIRFLAGDEDSQATVLATEANEHVTVTLQDGTVVRLAPTSELRFAEVGSRRSVTLRGRAFFAVTTREGQSFRVRLPHGEIEALGTRFGIDSNGDGFQVAVVEGEVLMAVRGERVSVVANQVGTATTRAVADVKQVDNIFQFVEWLGPFLVFSSTPLSEVAEEFLRRFDLRIEIGDEALLTRTVTGWFADQSPLQMLEGICRAVGAECTAREGGVRMDLASTSRPVARRAD